MNSAVPAGGKSLPLAISLENAPATDVSVKLTLGEGTSEHITFSPTVLTFNKDVNVRYFQISADKDYDFQKYGQT
jgi:hypothetical protein